MTAFILAGSEIAGSIGVVNFYRENKSCEIGYWLREDLQGRGIMTKACSRFISHLFRVKHLNRIVNLAATGNHKSQAVPLRLGFTQEGTLRQYVFAGGVFHDAAVFSLLKQEWEKAQRPQPNPAKN